MPYELSIYKARLGKDFEKWIEEYKNDELKKDAFLRASRINDFMQQIVGFADESAIPQDSVIREFIGGSINKY